MKETRRLPIKMKVINKTDLKRISQLFEEEYNKSNKKNNSTSLQIRLEFNDKSSIEVDSFNMLTNYDVIDTKKVSKITLTYYDYTEYKNLNLSLGHGNYDTNELIISSQNSEWVQAKNTSFEDVFKAIKNQDHFFLKYNSIFRTSTSIIFGLYIYKLWEPIYATIFSSGIINVEKYIGLIEINSEIKGIYFVVLFFLLILGFYLMGNYPTTLLFRWINNLWPNIEFNFGPEHFKIEEQRRKRLWILITVIILPILINKLF